MVQSIQKALIYCRISSSKQKVEGSGLESQEHRCRKFAEAKNYTVEKLFTDDVSGGGDFAKRVGMMALLQHLKRNRKTNYVVIFDDLKRFARDTRYHLKLKSEFDLYNATIECLNYRFDPTPEGRFVETIHAAQGQLEREQTGRQTIQKMIARMEQGYFVFRALGYRYEKQKGGGKILVPHEPVASIIKEALNGFASGRFQTQSEVKYFLETFEDFPKNASGNVGLQRVKDLLIHTIYAGLVEHQRWGISLRKGKHEPLISIEAYQKNQDRLASKAKVPARKNINEEFPLRGFIQCNDCNAPLTACFSKGQTKTYPYYLCHTKGCESYGKSIRRADIEGAFEKLLKSLTPTVELFKTTKLMLDDVWNFRIKYLNKRVKVLKTKLIEVERKTEKLIDLMIESRSPTIMQSYERRMKNLEREKLFLDDKIAKSERPLTNYSGSLRTVMKFLANPYALWSTGVLANQRAVLKLVFADNLAWVRNEGLRTATISLPFNMLEDFSTLKTLENKMVPGPDLNYNCNHLIILD